MRDRVDLISRHRQRQFLNRPSACTSNGAFPIMSVVALFLVIGTSSQQHEASSGDVRGSIDSSLSPLVPVLTTPAHPLNATAPGAPTTQPWHITMFQALNGAQVVLPLAMSPVCLAYNASTTQPLAVSLSDIAAAIRGDAVPASNPLSNITLVLARPDSSASNAIVHLALHGMGVVGLNGTDSWPSSARTLLVSDDGAVADVLRTRSQVAGFTPFVPLSARLGLPCASIQVSSTTAHSAKLTQETSAFVRVGDAQSALGGVPALRPVPDVYPFIGSLVVNVLPTATCEHRKQVCVLLSQVTSQSRVQTSLRSWGIVPIWYGDTLNSMVALARSSSVCPMASRVRVAGGSTVLAPLFRAWAVMYVHVAADAHFVATYTADGSQSGIVNVQRQTYHVGGSDFVVTNNERRQFPNIRAVPVAAFATAIVFNVPGLTELSIPRCLVVPLFAGEVSHWDDPRIAEVNPAIVLPHLPVIITARTSGSGTTQTFLETLAATISTCPNLAGRDITVSVTWPYGAGLFGESTSEVLDAIQQFPGAVGYASIGDAARTALPMAAVFDSADGSVLLPTEAAIAAALDAAVLNTTTGAVTLNPAISAYPFVAATYIMFPITMPPAAGLADDCEEIGDLLEVVLFGLRDPTAAGLAAEVNLVPLTPALLAFALDTLAQVTCNGQPMLPALAAERAPQTISASGPGVDVAIVSVVVCLLVLALLVAVVNIVHRELRKHRALARCPRNDDNPFAAVFVGVKNEHDLRQNADEGALRRALHSLHTLVTQAADTAGCHIAREVDEVTTLVVASSATQAFKFSLTLNTLVEQKKGAFSLELRHASEGAPSSETRGTSQVRSNQASSRQRQQHRRRDSLHESDSGDIMDSPDDTSSRRKSSVRAFRRPSDTVNDTNLNTSMQTPDTEPRVLHVNVGAHFGFGTISNTTNASAFPTYHGNVVDVAAVVADYAEAGQIVVSSRFIDRLAAEEVSSPVTFTRVASGSASMERGGESPYLCQIPSADGHHEGDSTRDGRAAADRDEGDGAKLASATQHRSFIGSSTPIPTPMGGIASALSRADAGLSQRVVAAIVIDIPRLALEPRNRRTATLHVRWVADILTRIVNAAKTQKAQVHALLGTRVVLTVNLSTTGPTKGATLNPLGRACRAALQIINELGLAEMVKPGPDMGSFIGQIPTSSSIALGTSASPTATPVAAGGFYSTSAAAVPPSIGISAGMITGGDVSKVATIGGKVLDEALLAQQAAAYYRYAAVIATPLPGGAPHELPPQFVAPTFDMAFVDHPNAPAIGASENTPVLSSAASFSPNSTSGAFNISAVMSAVPPRLRLCQLRALVGERPPKRTSAANDDDWMHARTGGAAGDGAEGTNESGNVPGDRGDAPVAESTWQALISPASPSTAEQTRAGRATMPTTTPPQAGHNDTPPLPVPPRSPGAQATLITSGEYNDPSEMLVPQPIAVTQSTESLVVASKSPGQQNLLEFGRDSFDADQQQQAPPHLPRLSTPTDGGSAVTTSFSSPNAAGPAGGGEPDGLDRDEAAVYARVREQARFNLTAASEAPTAAAYAAYRSLQLNGGQELEDVACGWRPQAGAGGFAM